MVKEGWKIKEKKIRNESGEDLKTGSHRWVSDRLPPAPGQEKDQRKKVTNMLTKSEVKEQKQQKHRHQESVKRKSQYNKQMKKDGNSCTGKVEAPDLSHRWVGDRLPL